MLQLPYILKSHGFEIWLPWLLASEIFSLQALALQVTLELGHVVNQLDLVPLVVLEGFLVTVDLEE